MSQPPSSPTPLANGIESPNIITETSQEPAQILDLPPLPRLKRPADPRSDEPEIKKLLLIKAWHFIQIMCQKLKM